MAGRMIFRDMEEAAGEYADRKQNTNNSMLEESETAWKTVTSAAQWDTPMTKKAALADLGQRTGAGSSTLWNRALVGEVFPRDTWLNEAATVTWMHYLVCASQVYDGSPESALVALDWIHRAEDDQLSTRRLKLVMAAESGDPKSPQARTEFVLDAVPADVLANLRGQLLLVSDVPDWAQKLTRLPAGTRVLVTVAVESQMQPKPITLTEVQPVGF